MFRTLVSLVLACFAELVCLHTGVAVEEKADKADMQATEVAEQFLKAITKPDTIEEVMKTVDVPFFANPGMGGENIKALDQLKKTIEHLLANPPPPMEYKVTGVFSFGSLPENVFDPQDHELLTAILKKQDRVVLFWAPTQRSLIAIPIRVKDNSFKVAGLHTGVSRLAFLIVAQEKEKDNKLTMQARETAKETARQFLKALKAKELGGLMKLAEAPWWLDGLVLKNQDEVTKALKSSLEHDRPLPKTDVLLIAKYGAIRDIFKEPKRETADEVFSKDTWLVYAQGERRVKGVLLFVRVRDGKGNVIGMGE